MEKLPRSTCATVQVKLLLAEHLPALIALHHQTDEHPWSEAIIKESFESDNYAFFALTNDINQLIGFVIFYRILNDIELHKIAIAPEYQNRGLGFIALQESLQQIGKFEHCFLEVRESNLAAIALYQKAGFDFSGQRPNYYGKESAILMQYKQKLD